MAPLPAVFPSILTDAPMDTKASLISSSFTMPTGLISFTPPEPPLLALPAPEDESGAMGDADATDTTNVMGADADAIDADTGESVPRMFIQSSVFDSAAATNVRPPINLFGLSVRNGGGGWVITTLTGRGTQGK